MRAMRYLLAGFAGLVIFAGCAGHRQIRTDFAPDDLESYTEQFPENDAGQVATSRKQVGEKVFENYDDFLMAHVEFDDQGQFWESEREGERNQLDALEEAIERDLQFNPAKYANGAVIVAFAHGWNNNSIEGNSNLDNFRGVMARLAEQEEFGRTLIGVYLSWRGRRAGDIPLVSDVKHGLTYWDRKETAQNIGQRAMGETLKRLSFLKNQIVEEGEGEDPRDARSSLVLVGHSFGGAAVFSGVSRFFEDELIKVERSNYTDHVDRNWDLVLLVNPAFEALQYSAIHRYSSKIPPVAKTNFVHLPRMLVIGARNDSATGMLLTAGQTLGDLFRPRQSSEHLDEGTRMVTALGHYEPFITHRLVEEGGEAKLEPYRNFENVRRGDGAETMSAYSPSERQRFLREFSPLFGSDVDVKRVLPFMVVQAEPEIVNGHSGIWDDKLSRFIVAFIDARENAVRELTR